MAYPEMFDIVVRERSERMYLNLKTHPKKALPTSPHTA